MNHKVNVVFALFATVLFIVCQWQLDLWCSPYVWQNRHWLEVLPFWWMWSTDAYVLAFITLNAAYWLGLISLWFWND